MDNEDDPLIEPVQQNLDVDFYLDEILRFRPLRADELVLIEFRAENPLTNSLHQIIIKRLSYALEQCTSLIQPTIHGVV